MSDSVSRLDEFFRVSPRPYAVLHGDCRLLLPLLPDESIDVTITSPPYFQQKDYGDPRQIGWNQTRDEYLESLAQTLGELFRVTRSTGSAFVVIGDTYKQKSLQLIPQCAALLAAQAGWLVRNDLIWHKTDAAPESVTDRWRCCHEHILFLAKRGVGYRFDLDALRIPYSEETLRRWGGGQRYGGTKSQPEIGPRGQRFARGKSFGLNPKGGVPADVLAYATSRSPHTHYATYPPELVAALLDATSRPGDVILDPFAGTGTTGEVALRGFRRFIGFDVNAEYAELTADRCRQTLGDRVDV